MPHHSLGGSELPHVNEQFAEYKVCACDKLSSGFIACPDFKIINN